MFIVPEGNSAVYNGTKKTHVVNGPPRATNGNCIFIFTVVTQHLNEQNWKIMWLQDLQI